MKLVNLVLSPMQSGSEVYAEPVGKDIGNATIWVHNVQVPDHLVGQQIAETDTLCVRDWTHPDIKDESIFPN